MRLKLIKSLWLMWLHRPVTPSIFRRARHAYECRAEPLRRKIKPQPFSKRIGTWVFPIARVDGTIIVF